MEIGYSSAFRSVAVAVNTATGMGYASYDAQPNLVLFDVMTGEIKAQIRDIGAWHGVAADPVLNRVYVRDSTAKSPFFTAEAAESAEFIRESLRSLRALR